MEVENKEIKKEEIKKIGSKKEVWDGLAIKTSGGLRKGDLILNKNGKVVSRRKSENGKKNFANIKSFQKKPEELQELRKKKTPNPKNPRKPKKIKEEENKPIINLKEEIKPDIKEESKGIELKPESVEEKKSAE